MTAERGGGGMDVVQCIAQQGLVYHLLVVLGGGSWVSKHRLRGDGGSDRQQRKAMEAYPEKPLQDC